MRTIGKYCMQPQVCTATPRRSLLGNRFYSSCCEECCCEEDGLARIRGGYDDPSEIGDESDASESDDLAIIGMAAEYEAQQNRQSRKAGARDRRGYEHDVTRREEEDPT